MSGLQTHGTTEHAVLSCRVHDNLLQTKRKLTKLVSTKFWRMTLLSFLLG